MRKEWDLVVTKMQCPMCKGRLQLETKAAADEEVLEGTLCCDNGHRFGIHGGVADFGSVEQKDGNAWSEYLKSLDYEELDRQIEDAKSEKEKDEQRRTLEKATNLICEGNPQIVVDIASGRGMLLNKLLEKISEETIVVSTDLSFEIMVKDRIKFKKLYPNKKIIYFACDATQMPFADGAADVTTSFFGVSNMLGIVEKGIAEASRVTKKGGTFVNCMMSIKEDSEGFRKLKEICDSNDMSGEERAFIQEDTLELHSRHFEEAKVITAAEAVYENKENALDLLPYPGEWYADNIFVARHNN